MSTAAAGLRLLLATAALLLGMETASAGTVGFQRVAVLDEDGKPRDVGIWYPSEDAASPQRLGPYSQTVATDGTISGRNLPLVLVLHGVQGMFENHFDTALALAEAGFVVAGIQLAEDLTLPARPRHVGLVLDYLFDAWPHRHRLDPKRVGLYGFSVAGFTALVVVGGIPDFGRVGPYCVEHPDRVCKILKERGTNLAVRAPTVCQDAPTFDRQAFHTRFNAAVVASFATHLAVH
jgi:predicted dienelactone hydrolase